MCESQTSVFKMVLFRIITAIMLVSLCSAQVDTPWNCGPIEEGSPLSISQFQIRNLFCSLQPTFRWTRQAVGSSETLISICDSTLSCTGNDDRYSISIASQGDLYYSNLTIKGVSVTQPNSDDSITLKCYHCNRLRTRCTISVYVKPVRPRCQALEVLDQAGVLTHINLTCSAERVHPAASCLFQLGNDGTQLAANEKCKQIVEVTKFRPGANQIRVKVKSSVEPSYDAAQTVKIELDVVLRAPTPAIECPGALEKDGYFKGESINCSCKLTDAGKPRGQPFWKKDGQIVSETSSHEEAAFLVMMYGDPRSNQTYVCGGRSSLGDFGIEFTPRFGVFYPQDVYLETSDADSPVDICCDNPGVLITCIMGPYYTHPPPRFALLVNGEVFTDYTGGIVYLPSDAFNKTYWFKPEYGGHYSVGCRVRHSLFPELSTDEVINMTIHSPVQLADSAEIKQTYYTKLGPDSELTISLGITAFPEPSTLVLYKGSPDDSNETTVDHNVTYRADTTATGHVRLSVRNMTAADLTAYTLVVQNGIGSDLSYAFTLEEDKDDLNVVPIVVGVVAGLVVLAIIVLVVVLYRRKKRRQGSAPGEDLGDTQNEDDKPGRKKAGVEDDDDPYNMIDDVYTNEDDDYMEAVSTQTSNTSNPNPIKTNVPKAKPNIVKKANFSKLLDRYNKAGKPKADVQVVKGKKKTVPICARLGNSNNDNSNTLTTTNTTTTTPTTTTTTTAAAAAAPSPGYYNIGRHRSAEQVGGPPPRPPRIVKSWYANYPQNNDDHPSQDDSQAEYAEAEVDGTSDADVHDETEDYYSTITEGAGKAEKILY